LVLSDLIYSFMHAHYTTADTSFILKLVGPIAQLLKYVTQTFICSAHSIKKLEGTLFYALFEQLSE